MWVIKEDIKVAPQTDLREDIGRYLAADSETRRLKLTRETVTPQSSVQTDNQQGPPQEDIDRHNRGPAQTERIAQQTDIGRKIVGDPGRYQSSSLDRFEERHLEILGSRQ